MFDYFKKLLRSDTPESSKRFNTLISILMLFFITIVTFIFIWFGKLSEDILITIVLGWFGLAGVTTAFTAFQRNNNGYGGTSYYNPTQYTPQNNNQPERLKIGNNQEEDLSAENDRISEII